jgi:hypothetical protein
MEISPPIPRNDIFWDTLVQIEEPCKIHLSKKRRHTRISNRFLDSQNLPTIVSDGKCRRVCCNVRSSASTTDERVRPSLSSGSCDMSEVVTLSFLFGISSATSMASHISLMFQGLTSNAPALDD